jgi:hypothetical protein
MKYIKTYESMITNFKVFETLNENDPQVGDYVIAECNGNISNKKLIDFVNNTIGKLIINDYDHLLKSFEYIVKYDYVPKDLKEYYFNVTGSKAFYKLKYWSPDKNDLLTIIEQTKYNL